MDEKETRIVKANHLLRAKVGMGSIDERKIRRSQKIIDSVDVDFKPMAYQYLDELHTALERARSGAQSGRAAIQAMTEPVMQIKANAPMFDFTLIGVLANVMLNFLETLEDVDSDVIDIVAANHTTLKLLVDNDMRGEGGEYGAQLQAEIKDACRRYFAKVANARRNAEDNDTFFIDS